MQQFNASPEEIDLAIKILGEHIWNNLTPYQKMCEMAYIRSRSCESISKTIFGFDIF